MKRILIIVGAGLILLFITSVLGLHLWNRHYVKEYISIAKSQYSGKAEDALIAYLMDNTHSPNDRSRIAVWTLGQIQSKKALPILSKLYRNDPKGKTCRHDTEVCQYGIFKAMRSIHESGWFLHRGLNK